MTAVQDGLAGEMVLVAAVFTVVIVGAIVVFVVRGLNADRPGADPRRALLDALGERAVLAQDLIDQVRPHAPHERWLFAQLEETMNRLDDALDDGTDTQIVAADRAFEAALHDVLALAEAYPDLTESEDFTDFRVDFDDAQQRRRSAIDAYAEVPGGTPWSTGRDGWRE